MYGSAKAMCGLRSVANGDNWICSFSARFLISFLVSIVLHLGILLLPVSQQQLGSLSRAGAAGLQVSISPVSPSEFNPERVPERATAERQVAKPGGDWPERSRALAVVPVVEAAKLDSKIDITVDDPGAIGFMILRVDIGQDGVVESSTVLYSELPAEVARQIEQKFASARYRPGSVNGERRKETLMFRVDVD
jgi:hypothetical protein